jgi:hypothetical protein
MTPPLSPLNWLSLYISHYGDSRVKVSSITNKSLISDIQNAAALAHRRPSARSYLLFVRARGQVRNLKINLLTLHI